MNMNRIGLSFISTLLAVSGGEFETQAQSFGFQFHSSQCEVNHAVLDTNEIQAFLAEDEKAKQINFLEYREELIIKVIPHSADSLEKDLGISYFEIRTKRNTANQLVSFIVGKSKDGEVIFRSDEPVTSDRHSIRSESVQSLSLLLLKVLNQSEHPELNYKGLYLASCEPGICFSEAGKEEFESMDLGLETPSHLGYQLELSRTDLPDQSISIDFEKSLLGQLNSIRHHAERAKTRSPFLARPGDEAHRLCLSLECEERSVYLETQSKEFKALENDFNRLTRHLDLLLRSIRRESSASD